MNSDYKVIDLLKKQERRHWTFGQIQAWKSSTPSLVLFHFGPRGSKRLGEWTQKERSSLTQALHEIKPTDDQMWGLVSLCVEGQERTGQQCKTFAVISQLSSAKTEMDQSEDSTQ